MYRQTDYMVVIEDSNYTRTKFSDEEGERVKEAPTMSINVRYQSISTYMYEFWKM